MYDGGKIITGLIVALALLTFPFWWNLGSAAPTKPEPVIAPEAKAAGKCVLPKDQIIVSHMQLLDDWRNRVVRDGVRYTDEFAVTDRAPEVLAIQEAAKLADDTILTIPAVGPARDLVATPDPSLNVSGSHAVEMSLQNNCLACHTSRKDFCDKCHTWANVEPFCWDCHLEPEEKK